MGWARLDDSFHDHPKLIGLSLEALGLWTKCFTWAHRHHASGMGVGFLPHGLPETFAGSRGRKLGNELVTHGLWDAQDNGWLIHDYADYLPASEKPQSASEVSKSRSEAGKRGAEARWGKANTSQADGKLPSDANGKPMPPTRPDPTPSSKEDGARKRAHRIPNDFTVTPDMVTWAREKTPAVDGKIATERFMNHFQAMSGRGSTKLDWTKAWRNWLLADQQTAVQRGWKPDDRQNRRTFNDDDE